MDSVLVISRQWAWGNLQLQRTKADGIDYPSMKFQLWSMSEDFKVGISFKSSTGRVCLIVVNQTCCGYSEYNLLGRMLRRDANKSLNKKL